MTRHSQARLRPGPCRTLCTYQNTMCSTAQLTAHHRTAGGFQRPLRNNQLHMHFPHSQEPGWFHREKSHQQNLTTLTTTPNLKAGEVRKCFRYRRAGLSLTHKSRNPLMDLRVSNLYVSNELMIQNHLHPSWTRPSVKQDLNPAVTLQHLL